MLEAPDEVRTLEESLEHWTIEMTSGGDGPTRDATPIRFLLRPVGQPSGLELTLEIERTAGAPRIRRLSAATRRSDAPQIVVPIHDTVAEFDDAAKPYPARLVITVVRSGLDGAPVTQRHVLEIERATSPKPDPDEARRRTRLLLEPAPGAEVTDRRLGLRYRGGDRRFECGDALTSPMCRWALLWRSAFRNCSRSRRGSTPIRRVRTERVLARSTKAVRDEGDPVEPPYRETQRR